jgi:hypothetical protein
LSCAARKAEKAKRQKYSIGLSRDWKQDLTSSNNRLNQGGSGSGRRQTAGSVACLRETVGPQRCLILPRRSREQASYAPEDTHQKARRPLAWLLATSGSYLLRTTGTEKDPREIWKTYIQLAQVEDAFRTTKSNRGMRPIYHHTAQRTQAHILVCFLALVLWRTLQQWMDCSGLGTAPRKLLEELREITSLDMLLPTRDNKSIRLRVVSTAPSGLKIMLQRLKLPLPSRPRGVENVVPTLAD